MTINKDIDEEWDNQYVNLDSENIVNIKSQSLKVEEASNSVDTYHVDINVAEKIEHVHTLLQSIKKKAAAIKQQTVDLNKFNRKLTILLDCIDAYSFEDTGDSINKTSDQVSRNIEKIEKEGKHRINESEENVIKKHKTANETETKDNRIDTVEVIAELFKNDSTCHSIAKATYEMILERETVPLDDIVKSFKYSKYKVIEILNVLIKNKIVLKSFEKGFVYRINK